VTVVAAEEVRSALASGGGVVALETSVIAHGLPVPRYRECIDRMTAAVRGEGAVPAWVAVVGGEVRLGVEEHVLLALAEPGRASKVARRDVAFALAAGTLGATTVSATIWAAASVGISVAATGGIGGVHPGSGDVSADLLELSRTPILLVCSGPKSIVDPVATAERLEELGVAVVGYRCDDLPFFLVERAPVWLEQRVDDVIAAARLLDASRRARMTSAVILANPIPGERAMDRGRVTRAVRACEDAAAAAGVRGKARTPFLLACLAEQTEGESLEANLALLEANAALAARVAVSAARLARA
jgi:pseudouridine-5'-phosphate glycosidase